MAILPNTQAIIRFSNINPGRPHKFDIRPSNELCSSVASDLNLLRLSKLRLDGTLSATGKNSWRLKGHIGATVEQACVLTLAPVQTRIDSDIERNFLPLKIEDETSDGPDGEAEMEQDETLEPLGTNVDLIKMLVEALSLELPAYPRVAGASFEKKAFAAPGIAPLSDDDVKPFANLSSLIDKSAKDK
jgi:uncharacterized metal-binding protein YceD (DUF177 family)